MMTDLHLYRFFRVRDKIKERGIRELDKLHELGIRLEKEIFQFEFKDLWFTGL
jgi:hypothetical protein